MANGCSGEGLLRRDTGLESLAMESTNVATVREVFDSLDVDGNGTLDHDEVKEAGARLGQTMTAEELDAAMLDMDADGNGNVDFDEFHNYFNRGGKLAFITLASDGDMGSVMRDHQRRVEKMRKYTKHPSVCCDV